MIEIQKRRIVVAFLLFFRRQFHIIAERHAQICVISDRNRQALVLERNGLIPEQKALISAQNSLVPEGSVVIPGKNGLIRTTIGELNAEQEALKSRLKEKTAQIDEAVVSLKAKLSEARKVIKLELPQTGWKEFGITDVR